MSTLLLLGSSIRDKLFLPVVSKRRLFSDESYFRQTCNTEAAAEPRRSLIGSEDRATSEKFTS